MKTNIRIDKSRFILRIGVVVFSLMVCAGCTSSKNNKNSISVYVKPSFRILVFTKTNGFYHESIPTGAAALQQLGRKNNFIADTTSAASYFLEDSLKNYAAVIFLNTTMNVLNGDQQVAFERYIQAGGGFVGIHAATDTEYDWPWYNRLVGAYFASHPRQQRATIRVVDKTHPSTSFLPDRWERYDEWYNFKSVQSHIKVLAYLDESTYQGGDMGDNHPFAWHHEFDGGRSFYTAGGHTKESYSDSLFMKHLLGGIQYAVGSNAPLNYSKAYAVRAPEDNRFTKTVLSNDLNEPMELAVAPDGRVFFTERGGMSYVYDPVAKQTKLLYNFPVKAVDKYLNGLIGITLDPEFHLNNFIYFFYSSSTGEQYHQNVSRFKLRQDGTLDSLSEKIIIKIPIDLEVSAHTGGSLAWDKNKNLYISTGDNTVPFESDGYAPLDERDGRKVYDAQRSAANTNDLRGKILRIHPEADGSYTIPSGNLFPPGTPATRPEIYVMGCRNPYRISVDPVSSIVYWGEVGPDAGRDSRHGPRGYDEFNQARSPGNFGWPYFVGNNIAYHDSDFATKAVGALFDLASPVNHSRNNSGIQTLPTPTAPLIWYPYNVSTEFPELGDGGRCAMGGPVYHFSSQSSNSLPEYYNKALFIYDWMRNWVFAVRMDDNYRFKRLEPFMHSNGDFRRPIDMEIGPEGNIYMLEYGSVYGIDNDDARLVRIDFNPGNRPPFAFISSNDTAGTAPYKVSLNSNRSYDPDEDQQLKFEWLLNGVVFSTERNTTYTFQNNGIYKPVLKITDAEGKTHSDTIEIKVGNTVPQVRIRTLDNKTFFFSRPTLFQYRVNIRDNEDSVIDSKNIKVSMTYLAKVAAGNQPGHQIIDENYNLGKNMIALSDCKACHQINSKSVGPSYMDISKKYINQKNAVGLLANKIIAGGGGVWGEHAMSAHPQISKEDAEVIVKYILSVSQPKQEKLLSADGKVILREHLGTGDDGRYVLTASYTDKGGSIVPLSGKEILMLRSSKVQAEHADRLYNAQKNENGVGNIHHGSYLVLRNIDLTDVTHVTYRYASLNKSATIQVRSGSLEGPLLSTVTYAPTKGWNNYMQVSSPVQERSGLQDLYFIFLKTDTPNRRVASLDWIRFEGGNEYVEPEKVKEKKLTPVSTTTKTVKAVTAPGKIKPAVKAVPVSGQELIAMSDCATCHTTKEKHIGPSYADISKRYRNDPGAFNKLAGKIINGGKGVWGDIPMIPHKDISRKEAELMVKYIMSIK